MALTQVEQGMLKDGILTADTAGRLKMADGFVNSAKMAAGAARANFGAGAVLQVVQGTTLTYTTTTSLSFVATNLTATITPSSSTSKILCLVQSGTWGSASDYAVITLYRNGTNLGAGSFSALGLNGTNGNGYDSIAAIHLLDSPASTSALTYTLYLRSYNSTTVGANDSTNTNTIILMEIAG